MNKITPADVEKKNSIKKKFIKNGKDIEKEGRCLKKKVKQICTQTAGILKGKEMLRGEKRKWVPTYSDMFSTRRP